MRHLDIPGEDMGGRLSRQRGGGAGRGGSPRASGQPPSRHFRLTAPRPSVLSHSTNEDAAGGGGGGHATAHGGTSSGGGVRGHLSPVSRRGSGPGSGSDSKGGRSGEGVGRDSSSQYASSSSSSSRRAVTGSTSRPPVSYDESLDADGIDDITPPASIRGGGTSSSQRRRSSTHQGAGGGGRGTYGASSPGKMNVQNSGRGNVVSTWLHVPGLRGVNITSSGKQQQTTSTTSTHNSEQHTRSSNRESKGAGRGGGGTAQPHTRPASPDYDSLASKANKVKTDRGEGGDGSGNRCKSAPPADAAYSRAPCTTGEGAPGDFPNTTTTTSTTPRGGGGYITTITTPTGGGGGQPQHHHQDGVYEDDQRPAGGRRCLRSPGAEPATAATTSRQIAAPQLDGRNSSRRPSAGDADGVAGIAARDGGTQTAYTSGAGPRQNMTRRPGERGAAGQQAQHQQRLPPDDKASYLQGGDGATPRIQQASSSESQAVPVTTTPRIDSSGIIDRSKFILENVGVLTDFYDVDSGTLGQGSYGSVAKARKKHTGQMRAIKTISKSQVKNLERFRQEIAIMKELVREQDELKKQQHPKKRLP